MGLMELGCAHQGLRIESEQNFGSCCLILKKALFKVLFGFKVMIEIEKHFSKGFFSFCLLNIS